MRQKKMIQLLSISTIFCVLVRCIHLLFFTTPETGFIKNGTAAFIASAGFWGLFALSAIVSFFPAAFFSHRKPAGNAKLKDYKPLKIFTITMGIYCFISGIPQIFSEASAWGLIGLASCILSGVFFILEVLKDEVKLKNPKILTLAPTIMFIYFTVFGFIEATGVALITENVIFTIYSCVGILYFATQGKILAEVNFRTNSAQLLPVGFLFFLVSITYGLPPILLSLIGKASQVHGGLTINHFTAVVSGAYALCFTLTLFSKNLLAKHKKTTDKLDFSSPETSTDFYA